MKQHVFLQDWIAPRWHSAGLTHFASSVLPVSLGVILFPVVGGKMFCGSSSDVYLWLL